MDLSQATPIMSDDSTLYFIYISCPAPTPTSTAPECSATQWWLNEVSLPYVNNTLLSPVTTAAGRKLLASGSVSPVTAPGEPFVDQFVLSMVRGSGVHNPGRVSLARTAAIWDAPDGQVSTGDKSDATSGRSLLNTPTSMTKRRLLAEELTATADASSHGRGRTLLDKNNIVGDPSLRSAHVCRGDTQQVVVVVTVKQGLPFYSTGGVMLWPNVWVVQFVSPSSCHHTSAKLHNDLLPAGFNKVAGLAPLLVVFSLITQCLVPCTVIMALYQKAGTRYASCLTASSLALSLAVHDIQVWRVLHLRHEVLLLEWAEVGGGERAVEPCVNA
jgi:hypothetical protein